jgi:hypothetical protein
MSDYCDFHELHSHVHGKRCGHTAIEHNGHTDYLHDGHLHSPHGDHVDEHVLEISTRNPAGCSPQQAVEGHPPDHRHGANCGHEAIPHGDHLDYLVNGRLHHPHGDHCDDHGQVKLR